MAEQRGFHQGVLVWIDRLRERGSRNETRATIRVIPEDAEASGTGLASSAASRANKQALFAQSY